MSQDQLVPRVDAEATGELERMLNGLPNVLVEGDRDKWLPVTGGRRSGKSNLAIFNAIWVDPDFDVETQIAYTAPDYVDICLGLRKGKAAILDEPVAGLLSFDANTGENKGRCAVTKGPRCKCRGCPACLGYGQRMGCERRHRAVTDKCRTCWDMEREIGWPPVVFGRTQQTLAIKGGES